MKNDQKNIVLIGMPGCGKSTIGKLVSKMLQREFCDVDTCIESREHATIVDIFKKGEKYFRDTEEVVIKEISKEQNLVIATGGGAIGREANITALREHGRIIFLNRPLVAISEDMDISSRPLLNNDNADLFRLYQTRYPLYKQYCDLEIINDKSLEEIAKEIIKIL